MGAMVGARSAVEDGAGTGGGAGGATADDAARCATYLTKIVERHPRGALSTPRLCIIAGKRLGRSTARCTY